MRRDTSWQRSVARRRRRALGKLGGPQSDDKFVLELDETIAADKAKNFGFWFGFGGSQTWPAARLGKPEAMQAWMQYLARPVEPVPGGTVAKVERTQSNGVKITQTCAGGSPCAITLDPRLGAETRTVEYQDSTGKRKARSNRQVVKRP